MFGFKRQSLIDLIGHRKLMNLNYSLSFIIRLQILLICALFPLVVHPISIKADQNNNNLPFDLVSEGWQEIVFRDKKSNEYSACGRGCIRVVSQSSVSMVGRRFPTALTSTSVLSWSWKVLKPVPLSDITSKGRDDRALALYITFPYDPETASLAEKLLRPAVELIEGKKAAGRMLSYIWVGHGNPGDLYQSPFYGEVNAMIIKRNASDPLDKWLNEQVNVVEDYQKAFGSKPKEILELLIGADTDDLAGSSIGLVKNLNIKSE